MVKIKCQIGTSLTELLITVSIFSVLIGGFSTALVKLLTGVSQSGQGVDQELNKTLIEKVISRKLAMSSLKTYGLSGSSTAEETHARNLVVSPGRCANYSSGGECALSTFVKFTSVANSSISSAAYCWSDPGRKLIIDSNVAQLLSEPGTTQNLIGLISPPVITEWGVESVQNVSLTDLTTGAPLRGECIEKMPRESNGRFLASRFREVTVVPVSIKGGSSSSLSGDALSFLNTSFPQRVSRLSLFTAGLALSSRGPVAGQPSMDFQVLECAYSATQVIDCRTSKVVATISRIRKVDVFEGFSIALSGQSAVSEWQISSNTQERSNYCLSPGCEILRSADWTSLSYAAGGESMDGPTSGAFSLLKQNLITSLRFVLIDENRKAVQLKFGLE